jgi:hypothetical protein
MVSVPRCATLWRLTRGLLGLLAGGFIAPIRASGRHWR